MPRTEAEEPGTHARYKKIISLRQNHRWTYRQIGDRYGVSVQRARQLYLNAKWLEERGRL